MGSWFLVTGAAGKTGRAVIRAIAGRGVSVRALIRRDEQHPTVREAGAADAITCDMRDRIALAQACRGVRAIYHIPPNMSRDEVAIGQAAIDAARAAGVQHFVYHSVLHPAATGMPHHARKLQVETLLLESGLERTVLQPAAYMQNLLAGRATILERGTYRIPYPPETRIALVDLEDVAEIAARVLTEEGHGDATYELVGEECPSQSEIAGILGETLGRPVRAERIPLQEWREAARGRGLAEEMIEDLCAMFRCYERFGLGGNSRVLGWLLGRIPTRLREFVGRHF